MQKSAPDDILSVLEVPPTYQELLETPALREIYKWHMVGLYCPENLLFREAVEMYWELFDKQSGELKAGMEQRVRHKAEEIVKTFCQESSILEVNISSRDSAIILKAVEEGRLSYQLFDRAIAAIDEDISRSLQQFWVTPVFLAYYKRKKLLDVLHASGRRAPGDRHSTVARDMEKEELLMMIRRAFGTEKPVVLRRVFDVSCAFTYQVTVAGSDTQRGWGVQRGEYFYFYGMDEQVIMKVSAAQLLGKASVKRPTPRNSESSYEESDDSVEATIGCFPRRTRSGIRRGASTNSILPKESLFWVKDPDQVDHGPFSESELKLWWQYHLMPAHTLVRMGRKGVWRTVESMEDVFPEEQQIQLINPGEVSSL